MDDHLVQTLLTRAGRYYVFLRAKSLLLLRSKDRARFATIRWIVDELRHQQKCAELTKKLRRSAAHCPPM